jgi:hypothetical protein
MAHPEAYQAIDPYQNFQQHVVKALTDVAGSARTREEWAEMRARAWAERDLLEAAALTFAEHLLDPNGKEYDAGANQALKERTSQMLRHLEPTSVSGDDWARARSKAWLAYDLIEAAALTLGEYLLGKKSANPRLESLQAA